MTLEARKIRLIMGLRKQNFADGVLAAVERTPRETFVPACFADQAYENIALPLAHGQTISQPGVVAFMVNALQVEKQHKVLEIGTGSGYQTAILAQLARRVYTMDIYREFTRASQQAFQHLGLLNITAMQGDGNKGWSMAAPFDRIILAAAAEHPPFDVLKQLKEDGIMIMPLGANGQVQQLVEITRKNNQFYQKILGNARFVPLQQPTVPTGKIPIVIGREPELLYA